MEAPADFQGTVRTGSTGSGPAERILVCVSASPYSEGLIVAGSRMAAGAPWFAVHVERPVRPTRRDRERLAAHLRLAQGLGAQVAVVQGDDPAAAVLAFAGDRGVTRIVVGRPDRVRLRERLEGTFVDRLIRRSGRIEVRVLSNRDADDLIDPVTPARRRWRLVAPYLAGVALVGVSLAVAGVLFGPDSHADVVMVLLLGVVVASLRLGNGPSLAVAILSAVGFDFFFTPPYHSFSMSDLRHAVTFGVMIVVALVVSQLVRRTREQSRAAQERARETAAMYEFTRTLSAGLGPLEVARLGAAELGRAFRARVVVRVLPELPDGAGVGDPEEEGAELRAAIDWVREHGRDAGQGTAIFPGLGMRLLPLRAPGGLRGIACLRRAAGAPPLDDDARRRLDAMLAQIAGALERAALVDESHRAHLEAERESMRNTMLGSISHDLRTPLAGITGAASTLRADDSLDPEARRELVQAILDESERMGRQVRDLLDLTRLESGTLELKREWQPLEEVAGAAFNAVEALMADRELVLDLPADLPLVEVDAVLVEKVLVNLLENAAHHTPPGTRIAVSARSRGDAVEVEVSDDGPGVPAGIRERVFEKFFQAHSGGPSRGTGLGLAVCKAVVELHGGTIRLDTVPGRGAVFRFTLPAGGGAVEANAPARAAAGRGGGP